MPDAPAPASPARSRTDLAGAVETAVFASDLHLSSDEPVGVARACELVARARDLGADALFLLGDVFKAWLGPSSVREPGLAPFLDALAGAVSGGTGVVLLHGNHDFLMGPELEAATGARVVGERLDVALGARRARLEHGDAFCTHDRGHRRLHAVLRSRPVRALPGLLPEAALRGLAGLVESGTGRATARKDRRQMDIVDDAVRATLALGYDVVVCGHVHVSRDVALDVGDRQGRLVVLADFETMGSHAVFADGALELVAFDRRLSRCAGAVVTIDGPAGSGKSSVARALAARLGFAVLDSGALYRTVTARALAEGVPLHDGAALAALARRLDLGVERGGGVRRGGVRVRDDEIRSAAVSGHVSAVSAHAAVRAALLDVQRRTATRHPGVVAEGRDMATVVFPSPDVAVYLDASAEERARRRLAQSAAEATAEASGTLGEVRAALEERDARDSSRAVAPLRRAAGAERIDTTDATLEQVVDRLERLVRERLGR